MGSTSIAATSLFALVLLAGASASFPAAAAPTPAGSCFDVVVEDPAQPGVVWTGTLHDPDAHGQAAYQLVRTDTGESRDGTLRVLDASWSLLVHAPASSARAETWQLADGETLRFAYLVQNGDAGPATGGGTANGLTWTATSRC